MTTAIRNVMTVNFTSEENRSRFAIYSKERFVVSLKHARAMIVRTGLTEREPRCTAQRGTSKAPAGSALAVAALLAGFGLAMLGMMSEARAKDLGLLSSENLLALMNTSSSLLHVGGGRDTFAVTPQGRAAGTALYNALDQHDVSLAKVASDIWDEIVPRENYGGEYTTLQWFAHYYMADEKDRSKMITDSYTRFFFDFFAGDDFAHMKEFLKRKYHAADIGDEETYDGQQRKIFLEDLVNFGNPRREEWEKTSAFIRLINPSPGEVIADVGAGPGYYSFKLAAGVQKTGKVYAIDTEAPHIKYVNAAKVALNVDNVETIQSDGRTIGTIEAKVDKVVLCSLYHNIYAMTNEVDREAFLNSIKNVMKNGAHLYLIDNSLVPSGELPYHGPFIAKELVAAQLVGSGFKLIEYHQPILQRYLLVLRYDVPKDIRHSK